MDHTQRNGLLLVFLSAAGYSFFPILTKALYESGVTQATDILTWRFILSMPLTWAAIALIERRGPSDPAGAALPRTRLLLMGILFGALALCAFLALSRLPASLYTVLIYTYPAMVALGSLLLGERLSGLGWLALALTLIGAVLTVPNVFEGFDGVDSGGVLFVFANAALYALYILLSGRILRGQRDLARASAWSITGSFLFVVVMTAVRGVNIPPNSAAWLQLIALAIVATVIPIFAFYAGMQKLGAARASIVSMIEPVMTLLWAALLLGEALLPLQIAGAVCILFSVLLLQLRRPARTPETSLPSPERGAA